MIIIPQGTYRFPKINFAINFFNLSIHDLKLPPFSDTAVDFIVFKYYVVVYHDSLS